jgi:uncharacterized membrane protein
MELFDIKFFHFIFKWLHVFFGILWIGHLYYFNFTQGGFMAQTDAPTKSQVQQKLLPIALWWFRWGAMWTFVTGLIMLHTGTQLGFSISGDWGIKILTGSAFGILMWANVWFLIWPKQKVVIQSASQVAGGGQAIPEAADCAAKALLASRTNTLFSIPMLFYMLGARNLPLAIDTSKATTYWTAFLILILALEFNAIKGTLGPMTTVKGVITSGFALTLVVFGLMAVLL